MAFTININLQSFTFRSQITGQIWFDFEKKSFPDKRWVDFPIIILGWWLENLKPLLLGKDTFCECCFMDGPYLFQVLVENRASWKIKFIESHLSGNICTNFTNTSPKDFVQMLIKVTEDIVAYCERQQWTSKDIDILVEHLDFYKKLKI